jgi:hypothetical protein
MRFLLAAILLLVAPDLRAQPAPWPRAPVDFASRAEIESVAAAFPNSSNMQRRRLGPEVRGEQQQDRGEQKAHDPSPSADGCMQRLMRIGRTANRALASERARDQLVQLVVELVVAREDLAVRDPGLAAAEIGDIAARLPH